MISEDAIRTHIAEYKESKKLKPENGGSTEKYEQQQREWLAGYEKLKQNLPVDEVICFI